MIDCNKMIQDIQNMLAFNISSTQATFEIEQLKGKKNVDAFVTMSKSVLEDLNIFDKNKPRKYTPHPLYDNFGEIIPKNNAKKQINYFHSPILWNPLINCILLSNNKIQRKPIQFHILQTLHFCVIVEILQKVFL